MALSAPTSCSPSMLSYAALSLVWRKHVHDECEKLDSATEHRVQNFIVDKRTDVSGIVIEPVLMSSLHVAKS